MESLTQSRENNALNFYWLKPTRMRVIPVKKDFVQQKMQLSGLFKIPFLSLCNNVPCWQCLPSKRWPTNQVRHLSRFATHHSAAVTECISLSLETKVLYGLLTVFQEGKLEDYHTYIKDNGGEDAVLVPWGLSPDACVRYMRILSMCSLAAEHEEIPYTSIAQTLQLPSEDEVESWVIAAVSSGLLAAKMDQLQHKVMVERSVVRRFDLDQWKVLQSQLNLWKQNLKGILDAFKQTQQGAAALSASHNAA
mmetsp:Transcript_21099/g.48708  ORF Transcript_21099/g.48708 Transcript_21099/m.48708 type:complete len:250 (-) Transcript_21099:380-1129(-)